MINTVIVVPVRVVSVGDHVDDVCLASDSPAGQAARHYLGQGRQIRPYTVAFLDAARRSSKSGHYFIKYKDNAILGGEFSQSFQIAGHIKRQLTKMGAGRFQDYGRDVEISIHRVFHGRQVSGRNNKHGPPTGFGYTRRRSV